MNQFKGTGVAVVTPFDNEGRIDYPALGVILNHMISGGVDYFVVLGTTGETATLNKEEKKEVYSFVSKTVNGRIPLMAGIGGNSTSEVLDTLKMFDFKGYSAVLSVCPYYNKPNQAGIIAHYKKIADASPVPVMLYNVPGRTGVNMTADTTLELADHKNIFGMKEASGNFNQCMEIIRDRPKNFLVVSGDDAFTLPLLSVGMDGVISVIANAYPQRFSNMVKAALAGDYAKARKLHYPLLDPMNLIFADGSPGGIKLILSEMGLCKETVREPLAPVGDVVRRKLLAAMKKVK